MYHNFNRVTLRKTYYAEHAGHVLRMSHRRAQDAADYERAFDARLKRLRTAVSIWMQSQVRG